jgi:C4-type Zn-finger protein
MNCIDLSASTKPPEVGIKAKRTKLKQDMNQAKTYQDMCKVLGVNFEEASKSTIDGVLPELRKKLQREEKEIEADAANESHKTDTSPKRKLANGTRTITADMDKENARPDS